MEGIPSSSGMTNDYWADLHRCGIVQSEGRGRVVVATENIEEGTVVCRDTVHAVCAFEFTKKKVCAQCLRADAGRLDRHCSVCHNAFYCSDECQADAMDPNVDELHAEDGTSVRANAVPHGYLCEALEVLNHARFDKSMTADLRVLVEVYAWRAIEREGRLREHRKHGWYEDFLCLQEHPEAWTEELRASGLELDPSRKDRGSSSFRSTSKPPAASSTLLPPGPRTSAPARSEPPARPAGSEPRLGLQVDAAPGSAREVLCISAVPQASRPSGPQARPYSDGGSAAAAAFQHWQPPRPVTVARPSSPLQQLLFTVARSNQTAN